RPVPRGAALAPPAAPVARPFPGGRTGRAVRVAQDGVGGLLLGGARSPCRRRTGDVLGPPRRPRPAPGRPASSPRAPPPPPAPAGGRPAPPPRPPPPPARPPGPPAVAPGRDAGRIDPLHHPGFDVRIEVEDDPPLQPELPDQVGRLEGEADVVGPLIRHQRRG